MQRVCIHVSSIQLFYIQTISFVCHYWQWPILINCVMCYYLCVLRWLMRPILALNCLLQIEQERSKEESYVGEALALAFRRVCFFSASLILFASYSPAPLLMRPRDFVWSCAVCSHDSVGMLRSLREALRVSIASSDHHGSVFQLAVFHRGFSLANVHQVFWAQLFKTNDIVS